MGLRRHRPAAARVEASGGLHDLQEHGGHKVGHLLGLVEPAAADPDDLGYVAPVELPAGHPA